MVQTSLGTLLVSICLHSIVRKRVSSVGVALIMDHSGMIHLLAKDVSESVGPAFPLFSPLIGTLGAFVTGSNTNSNVIFAPLQQQTAALIGTSVLVLLGAQTTGGALGYAGASQGDRGL
jgi:lactate permease